MKDDVSSGGGVLEGKKEGMGKESKRKKKGKSHANE